MTLANISEKDASYWIPSKIILRSDQFNIIDPDKKRIIYISIHREMADAEILLLKDSSVVQDILSYVINVIFEDVRIRDHLFNVHFYTQPSEVDKSIEQLCLFKMNETQFSSLGRGFNAADFTFNGVPLVLE